MMNNIRPTLVNPAGYARQLEKDQRKREKRDEKIAIETYKIWEKNNEVMFIDYKIKEESEAEGVRYELDVTEDMMEIYDRPVENNACNLCPKHVPFANPQSRMKHQSDLHPKDIYNCRSENCGCIFRLEVRRDSHESKYNHYNN